MMMALELQWKQIMNRHPQVQTVQTYKVLYFLFCLNYYKPFFINAVHFNLGVLSLFIVKCTFYCQIYCNCICGFSFFFFWLII